ncbi:MAG: hypothetical protein GWM90_29775 [Gemmatimonadetes bacterium]|nr:hypothetical protein [Gemmatimonadota bacterium]NIQ59270.1 hypothetical protein [Gemmatimonadota bacterium]NIU79457.1 hypothetical protein [Gammaproteobacteria bacterium]NIX48106.1 hypothetical protein [Gemmatimonadota bacterium]NIY12489.1 hypothetical protein [Gemmatimonadota bacterium]
MRGGSAILCPSCHYRQVVGSSGEKVELPLHLPCAQCGAPLLVERSESGGAHVTVEAPGTR